MPAACVNLCEKVVAAIRAASDADSLARRVDVVEKYGLVLENEKAAEGLIFVEPGPWQMMPGTLDGTVDDQTAVRIVFWSLVHPEEEAATFVAEVKGLLLLAEQVVDAAANLDEDNFNFVSATIPDGIATPYDPVRLRADGIFHAEYIVNFDVMRDS